MARKSFHLEVFLMALAIAVFVSNGAWAGEPQIDGKISVPQNAPLAAVCTDPIIQRTLEEDFRGGHRAIGTLVGTPGNPVTVTVIMTEKLLKPGVVLRDLGPADPFVVAKLLRQAGTEPPPIGDTGDQPLDPYSESVRRQFFRPDDPMRNFRDYQDMKHAAERPEGPRFGANGNAKDEEIFDHAIVAQASATGTSDQMTALLVAHPGDDIRTAKELLAEEIANSILH
jgi:hypothetical protein